MNRIVIVDLGTGNLRSVSKAVACVGSGHEVRVTANPEEIATADYLILPGQGAIGAWIRKINHDPALEHTLRKRLGEGPALGICLGLQALYGDSEENQGTRGLDILKGRVRHFSSHERHQSTVPAQRLKIPHTGWNTVSIVNDHPLWHGIEDGERFYFVHSYYVESDDRGQVAGECGYGNRFTAAAAHENLFATQFHPEKSQRAGLQLLKNFLRWNGAV